MASPAAAPGDRRNRAEPLLERRLESYGHRAAAERRRALPSPAAWILSSATAAAAVAGSAEATLLYSGVQDIVRADPFDRYSARASVDLDLDFDGADDVTIVASYPYDYAPNGLFQGNNAQVVTSGVGVYLNPLVREFALGESVTASAPRRAFAYFYSLWTVGQTGGFLGPQPALAGFEVNGRLGWIRLVFDPDFNAGTVGFRVVDWAVETQPGVPIAAGAVPEPSTALSTGLGLLALGARGVRRRRPDGAKPAEVAA